MENINPFENAREAVRYERYRPRYHHIPLSDIQKTLGRGFVSALDVACGTGHSTLALSQISKRTVGCDLSSSMLDEARKNHGIEFYQANAEELPFGDAEFDFVNISMGFHWVNQDKFLAEVRRVLSEGGHLCVDNYGFTGKVSDDPGKQRLHHELFEKYLPPASRKAGYPTDVQIHSTGFRLVKEIRYEHEVVMDADEFINLIMTWSNYQVQSDEQKMTTASKMREIYAQVFEGKRLNLDFGGRAMLYGMANSLK